MENHIFELQFSLDTFYFLICGALVMWMAAGFAMLEAGLVRAKNTTEILTKNIALFAIACTMYLICGYHFMYGGAWFLSGIGGSETLVADKIAQAIGNGFGSDSATYADSADFFFQVVFVATSMSVVSGAVAERMKLWVFLAFAVVMTAFIYPVEGALTWGSGVAGSLGECGAFSLFTLGSTIESEACGGTVFGFGFSDFAGSGIVHLAGAAAALAGVLLVGARAGKYRKDGIHPILGANLPLAALGTMILWLGWFGFNGGSVLKLSNINAANSVALVFVNTNAAAAAGAIGALLLGHILFGKADLTMLLNGALAGLVAITAEPSTPTPLLAAGIGLVAGLLVVASILFLDRLKIDDPVGAISVHGVCGLFGLLVVPLSNSDTTFGGQLGGGLVIFAWVFACAYAVFWVLKKIFGLRISAEDEYQGADISECGQEAYPEFANN